MGEERLDCLGCGKRNPLTRYGKCGVVVVEAGACRFKGRKLSLNDMDIFPAQCVRYTISRSMYSRHAESYTTKTVTSVSWRRLPTMDYRRGEMEAWALFGCF